MRINIVRYVINIYFFIILLQKIRHLKTINKNI